MSVEVKEVKEAKMWAEVTPEMISGRIHRRGERLLLHSPSYRSEILIKFIDKLDMRLETTIKRITTSTERRLESPTATSVPKFAKSWTVRKFDKDKAGGVHKCTLMSNQIHFVTFCHSTNCNHSYYDNLCNNL